MANNTTYITPTDTEKGAIITLRHLGHPFPEIYSLLAIPTHTCNAIYARATKRAENASLPALLQAIHNKPRSGRPHRFPPGSAISKILLQTATKDQEHEDIPHEFVAEEVTRETRIYVPHTTTQRILKEDHGIIRRRPPKKLHLKPYHKATRIKLAE